MSWSGQKDKDERIHWFDIKAQLASETEVVLTKFLEKELSETKCLLDQVT